MEEKLQAEIVNAKKEMESTKKEADLLNVKAKYLGKNSILNTYLGNLKEMSIEDKKKYGPLLNNIKIL